MSTRTALPAADGLRDPRRLWLVAIAMITAIATLLIGNLASPSSAPPAYAATDGDPSFVLTQNDLEFILRQIQVSEAHAAGNAILCTPTPAEPRKCAATDSKPTGLRTVSGEENNINPNLNGSQFGASDVAFPRLVPAYWRQADPAVASLGFPANTPAQTAMCAAGTTCYQQTDGIVYDSDPRTVSNLIVDQNMTNPAIQDAVAEGFASEVPGIDGRVTTPNTAPDEGLSAPFNTFMGFFGQFFDHGLDLVGKGGNGTIVVPLQPDDPLFVAGSPTNFITLSRATRVLDEAGNPTTEHKNITSPFIDQNQTYASHPSHQVFLRAYALVGGAPQATGHLIEGVAGGMSKWRDVKAQANDILGIQLTDADLLDIPLLATDPYGNFIPGANGYPQFVVADAAGVTSLVPAGPGGVPVPDNAVGTGHAFLDDIAHGSTPVVDANGNLLPRFNPDGSPVLDANGQPVLTGYDNATLDEHFMAGDGRVNENIGLTAVHAVFHAEHNRMVGQVEDVLNGLRPELLNPESAADDNVRQQFANAFRGEAHTYTVDAKAGWELPQPEADDWTYEQRLFQAAKFATEMQYQHLVFEEFARKLAPVGEIVGNENGYNNSLDPAIFAEFAHTVYRFGHSMMTDTIGRSAVDQTTSGAAPTQFQDVPLLEGFLNPVLYDEGGTIPAEEAAGSLINGMTSARGSQIDQHVVDTLRNNLLGLPLDLPSLNLMRGRDTGVPPLQEVRQTLFERTGNAVLEPYANWRDFGANIKNGDNFGRSTSTASLINFVAAYGKHPTILAADTIEAKRDAASLIVDGQLQGEEFFARLAGASRFETAARISFDTFPTPPADGPGIPVAYITNGLNFPDALAGGVAAAAEGGPILLTNAATPGEIGAATAGELIRLRPQRIVVLGGTAAVSTASFAALAAYTDGPVVRIGGADRYATAAQIAQEFAAPGVSRVFIANGLNYADALAASAVGARDGSPILLATPTSLPQATRNALAALDPAQIVIVGGTGAVGTSVANALTAYGPVTRVAGADRYATAVAISQRFFTSAERVYIATGTNFPDALAGGVAAGLNNAPLLLVPQGAIPASVMNEIARLGATQIRVLGGPAAVSTAIEAQLVNAFGPPAPVIPADRFAFMDGTGAWANVAGETVTGLEDVEFWIGGLAERLQPFQSMLGSTFEYVFTTQLENLQFADRFYYLFRNPGQQLFSALEGNTFSDMIQRNTDASNLPADIFSVADEVFDIDALPNPVPEALEATATSMRWFGPEHVEFHGNDAANNLRGDEGDDAIWGYGGNDRIEGGSGADSLVGGTGDDIITDIQGDENMKGKQGNDVISTGNGFDLAQGGLGDDFVTNGSDEKTVFGSLGDDIVLGTDGRLVVQGNEGNDWLESGIHGDLLQGDNADQQQNDTIGGDDVVIAGGNIDDVEGEGGDDIIVGRESGTTRFLGNLGYDWVSFYGETVNMDIDLSIFLEQTGEDPQRDRYDQLEAVSGGAGNDTILGNLVDGDILLPEDAIFHKLSQRALDLVDGFEALLRPGGADYSTPFLPADPFDPLNPQLTNQVMLGGAGSDVINGRGGSDFIDGDSVLQVQLGYQAERFDSADQISARMLSGEINPGAVDIFRSIVNAAGATDVDTAQYVGDVLDYSVTNLGGGYWRVEPLDPANPPLIVSPLDPETVFPEDGFDVLVNVEQLRFANGGCLDITGAEPVSCEPAGQVALTLTDPITVPTEGEPVTATVTLPDGVTPVGDLQFSWQTSASLDGPWGTAVDAPLPVGPDVAGGLVSTYTPNEDTITVPPDTDVGMFLRVVVQYQVLVDGVLEGRTIVGAPLPDAVVLP
ncbi:cell wall-binding repeat-containing protein [Agromyces sp. SYSU K20354]|uniref:cell wall-binding repeat-containing protein n=1 Tax=Agromyces cavernae TaxID=2898659 RepID=UPI001E63FC0B|nr:cell wall-binding repeat-containing protein [Agromyces cavernae]MCD2442570.1 cell wall-binding repeat-containing protein [Agromyces cavernae]